MLQKENTNYTTFCVDPNNKNFKTRFKEHKKIFYLSEERSNFANHIIEEGHETKNMGDTMYILHKENNPEKIDKLEDKDILKQSHY